MCLLFFDINFVVVFFFSFPFSIVVHFASLHMSLAISAFDGIKIGFCNKIAFIESISREWNHAREQTVWKFHKTENVSLLPIETVFPPSFAHVVCVCVCVPVSARARVYSCCVLYVHDRLISFWVLCECLID